MYHVVYLSFENDGRDYIGRHSSENPYDDYMGSFTDLTFDPDGKIILGYYLSAEESARGEIQWQRVFSVVEDDSFANRSYQTSTSFITPGPRSEETKRKISESMTGAMMDGEVKQRIADTLRRKFSSGEITPHSGPRGRKKKRIRVTSPSGEVMEFLGFVEAAEALSLDRASLNATALGYRKSHHGYRVEYVE